MSNCNTQTDKRLDTLKIRNRLIGNIFYLIWMPRYSLYLINLHIHRYYLNI